jgi:recombination protein RecR
MASHVAGPEIERLVQLLARLPGLGPRSARRAALHLIKKREELLGPLGEAMQVAHQRILTCSVCGNIDTIDPCTICRDTRRDSGILLIVETVSDLWALERARLMPARYHVLGGVLSPLDGVGPDDINIARLLDRIREGEASERAVREAILAVNATVDGQTTAHYIADLLAPLGVKTTRLAHGVPVGGELDYLDEGTLAAALERRTAF